MSTAPTNSSVKPGNDVDRLFAGVPCLCDGAMGTMLLDRGISLDRCYEELNLSLPETIADIHTKYLRAGAQVIETNTFGANSYRLEHFGLRNQLIPINLAGVHMARQCANQFPGKSWVAGSVGPLGERLEPLGPVSLEKARSTFAEQIRALAEGGPGVGIDLLMIETMTSLAEATEAIRA
ncbi:MAG: homocysteine S-methyltransferase family protein, partial [Acidobacteriota bacterium]|nr:homocysteine S-methyltransferase family protein [Acidobacteriota bacterium]